MEIDGIRIGAINTGIIYPRMTVEVDSYRGIKFSSNICDNYEEATKVMGDIIKIAQSSEFIQSILKTV